MNKKTNIFIIISFIIIAIIMSYCFKTNYWNKNIIGRDASVFVVIGEAMHEGKVPYRDIFDHKGPLLYFINYVGTIFPGYIMLYIIELIFLVIDLLLIYKIANHIGKNTLVSYVSTLITIIPLLLVIQGGNFVEEYALPFILLALYVFIKEDKSIREYILSGLSLGAVVLLRPNMAVVWIIGYIFITIELLYKKDFKEFFKAASFSIIGLLSFIAPFIIYLLINGAFDEFIKQYIIFNIKYANSNSLNPLQFLQKYEFVHEYIIGIIIMINVIFLIKELINKNKEASRKLIFSLLFIILTTIIVIMPCNDYKHYAIILIPCYIIPVAYFIKSIQSEEVLYIMLIFIIMFTPKLMKKNKVADFNYNNKMYDTCNYIKTISREEDDVIVIGNFCIMYILSERTTDCKYIYQLPPAQIDVEIRNEVKEYLHNNLPDLIVYMMDTRDYYFYGILTELIDSGRYELDNTQKYPILLKKEGEIN